jgi:hypothetical protein
MYTCVRTFQLLAFIIISALLYRSFNIRLQILQPRILTCTSPVPHIRTISFDCDRVRTYLCFFSAWSAVFFCISSIEPCPSWRSAATASSLSLASSGFQCPLPSFCFCNASSLCFSLCAACSGLSISESVPMLHAHVIHCRWGKHTAVALLQSPNTRGRERPRRHRSHRPSGNESRGSVKE